MMVISHLHTGNSRAATAPSPRRKAMTPLVMFLVCSSVSGCKLKEKGPGDADKGRASMTTRKKTPSAEVVALRDEVIANVVIFDRPEYTPKDLALYDGSIEWALYLLGSDPSKRAAVIDFAAESAALAIQGDASGLAALEKLISDRYYKPVIRHQDDLVHIDLGIIAGSPARSRHGLAITSKLEDIGGGLIVSEVIRNLRAGIAAQPGAKVYQVEVDIPSRYFKEWTYVYPVSEDVIRVFRKDQTDKAYVTGNLGGDLDKVTSFHWSALRAEPLGPRFVRPADSRGRAR
jgi:hypothetical protein